MSEPFSIKTSSKNFLALSIVLGGLFLGSLFVDIGQLVIGRGFSQHIIRDHEVLEQNGKTWVAYRDPKVTLTLLTDTQCTACNADEALVWLRRVIPTLAVTTIEVSSEAGRALALRHHIMTVPAFLFGESISHTDFYTQAPSLFQASEKNYLLDMTALGLPVGKYLQTPEITAESVVLGNRDASLHIVIYSDFQCSFCGGFHKNQVRKLIAEYGDRAAFVFKAFPLEAHPRAPTLAAAALCAHAQGKYMDYANALFTKQHELERRSDTKQELKNIAWMNKLDWKSFSLCIDQHRYQDQVKTEADEARALGLTATPAIFVGDRFFSGAVEYDLLKQAVDESLQKP